MPNLKIYLLGAPLVELGGKPAEFDTRKAIALLAYLSITREDHTRDALATVLWPELDQSRARAALRRTLSSLKNAVGEGALNIEREILGLNPAAEIWLDVEVFQRHLEETQTHGHSLEKVCPRCLAPLSAAVAVYRGDFLSGFTLRDSPSFDDWQFFQTDDYRRKFASALEKLAQGYAAQEEFEKAIEVAHRWLALDQLHEPAHRQLMKLYAFVGHRNKALRQYRVCVRILSQELDVAPLEETVQLYEEIRDNRFPVEKPASPEENVVKASPPPLLFERSFQVDYALVGRSDELGRLIQTYDSVAENGRFVVIEGEAGIGKTRLADEFLAHAWGRGAVVVKSRCYEGEEDLSYGPFVEGLRVALKHNTRSDWFEQLSSHWIAEVARLLPELLGLRSDLPELSPLEGPGAQSRFFEAITQFILTLCEGPVPGVLFIDDLHWADAASLDLMTYLARRVRRHPLLILSTWRAEQVGIDHRLNRLLVEMQRAGTAESISLSRLSPADVKDLVDSLSKPVFSLEISERLYQETEGLPFFLIEYLSIISKERASIEDIQWSLPGGVRDLLHSRLREVSDTGWQILTTGAVIGRSFGFNTLRAVSGRTEEEAITALEDLISQGLVREVEDRGDDVELFYDFSHEKLRTLVYEETSLARQRLLHRRVAEHLVDRARFIRESGHLAGQIAHHYQLAGEEKGAAKYYQLAGEHARGLFANEDALSHFQTALALGHVDAAYLHEVIGDLQTLLGAYDAALSSYETAAAIGKPAKLPEIEHKLGIVHHRLGEWGSAESHFQSALAVLDKQNGYRHRSSIYADWSLAAYNNGQPTRARELARKALELAEKVEDKRALAQAHNLLGILARGCGDLDRAREHLQNSLDLAQSMGDLSVRVAALNNLALVNRQDNDFETAISRLKTALSLCTTLGDRHREAALHNNLADLYHAIWKPEESMSHLKQSVIIYAEIGEQAGTWQPEVWKLVEW